jgi:hypothetical protein
VGLLNGFTENPIIDPSPYRRPWPIGAGGDAKIAVFQLTSALSPGVGNFATAAVIVHNDPDLPALPTSITVYNTGGMTGYVTCGGVAVKVKLLNGNFQWWVIDLNQYCLFYTVQLTTDTHGWATAPFGSVADQIAFTTVNPKVLTPYPFSFFTAQTIFNPFNHHGKAGDTLLVAHVEDGYTFNVEGSPTVAKNIILDVNPAYARRLFFELTEDAPLGQTPSLTGVALAPIGDNSGEMPDTCDPEDKYYHAHNAKEEHTGIASYDLVNDKYVVEHVEHIATRVACTIYASFCDTPATFVVGNLQGLNGITPTEAQLTVDNRYGLRAATIDDPISVLWDNITGEWYPEFTAKSLAEIRYVINSVTLASGGPFTGLKVATVTIERVSPCSLACLLGTSAQVVDDSECIFDLDNDELVGYRGWATEGIILSREDGAPVGTLSPCTWFADNRCCGPADFGSGGE